MGRLQRSARVAVAISAALGCDATGSAGSCQVTVGKSALSAKIPTVGVVEWSLAGEVPSSAKIVYALRDPHARRLESRR